MSAGFSSVEYVFNANRTLPANAALGIFSAADSNAGYGTGGDDTAAINAALSSAIAAGGAVAFLPPPPAGVLRISSQLVTGAAWLVGASPGVTIQVIPGSNLDWAVSSGAHGVVDYRTVCIVNRRTQTLGGTSYTLYDPANPAQLFTGGGLMNLTFQGDPAQAVGLGHGALYNAALDLQLFNCFFQSFIGEGVSLWDCARTRLVGVYSTGCGRTVGVHRACYDVSVLGSHGIGGPNPSYLAYTEQFQVPNGPLLTLSPQYTKFVDAHHYSATQSVSGFDLEGAALVNLTGCTADNVSGALPYQTGTRFGKPVYQVLADVNPVSVAVTAPIVNTGTATAPNIGLSTPLAIALGGTGTATPTFAATAPVTFSGTWPNITVALSTPLAVSFGGTGTTTPGLVQGTGITITGTWPNQTITNSAPGATALAGLTTDVLISSPADGQVLQYVGSASKWENKPASGGGLNLPFTIVQESSVGLGGVGSATVTLPQATAGSGNTLLVFVSTDAGQTPASSGFSTIVSKDQANYAHIAVLLKATAGETSITITGLNYASIYVCEIAGARSLDTSATLGVGSPTNVNAPPSITPAVATLCFAAAAFANIDANTARMGPITSQKWLNMSVPPQGTGGARSLALSLYTQPGAGALLVPPPFFLDVFSGGAVALATLSIK